MPLETVQTQFVGYHNGDQNLTDSELDGLLGLQVNDSEEQIMRTLRDDMPTAYRHEELWLGTSHFLSRYEDIRSCVQALPLGPNDVVYDLGSGYGRLPLYVGLTTPAQAKGIEILAERSEAAQDVKDDLGLESVEFVTGNVLDQDLSDGTVFYMFNPFTEHTFGQVKDKLKALAATKSITLVVANNYTFAREDWLTEVARPNWLTVIYQSSEPRTDDPTDSTDSTPEDHNGHNQPSNLVRQLGSSIRSLLTK